MLKTGSRINKNNNEVIDFKYSFDLQNNEKELKGWGIISSHALPYLVQGTYKKREPISKGLVLYSKLHKAAIYITGYCNFDGDKIEQLANIEVLFNYNDENYYIIFNKDSSLEEIIEYIEENIVKIQLSSPFNYVNDYYCNFCDDRVNVITTFKIAYHFCTNNHISDNMIKFLIRSNSLENVAEILLFTDYIHNINETLFLFKKTPNDGYILAERYKNSFKIVEEENLTFAIQLDKEIVAINYKNNIIFLYKDLTYVVRHTNIVLQNMEDIKKDIYKKLINKYAILQIDNFVNLDIGISKEKITTLYTKTFLKSELVCDKNLVVDFIEKNFTDDYNNLLSIAGSKVNILKYLYKNNFEIQVTYQKLQELCKNSRKEFFQILKKNDYIEYIVKNILFIIYNGFSYEEKHAELAEKIYECLKLNNN